MRVGDKDGLDDIYDEAGDVILMEDEELLIKEPNIVPTFKTTWRRFGGEDVMDSMNGALFLTNRRLVFVATPETIGRIGGGVTVETDGPKAPPVIKGVDKLKGVGSGGAVRDYFELLVKEVLGCEIKEGVVSAGQQIVAYIMASGKQFTLTFLAQDNSKLLERFRKNTVESVDELTENLKKHFENIEWVHG